MRIERKQHIGRTITGCPTDENNSAYIESINETKANLGDWELQSSNSYKVPPEKQVNFKRKLQEMICSWKSNFDTRKAFNSKVGSLQRERFHLVQEIERKKRRMQKIQRLLQGRDQRDILISSEPIIGPQVLLGILPQIALDAKQELSRCSIVLPQIIDKSNASILNIKELSDFESDETMELKALLQFEIQKLSKEIEEMAVQFDQSLYKLSKDRFLLLLETKTDEIYLTNMFYELDLLRSFEETDKNLRGKLDDYKKDKLEVS